MKKIILSSFIMVIVTLSVAIANDAKNLIDQYELRNYSPQKEGLKDLVFEARIEGLEKILSSLGTFGSIGDLHFKIYWMIPNQYKIEVNGLPKGFEELRNDLTALIKTKLEFVLPLSIQDKLVNYNLLTENNAQGTLVKASDKSGREALSEFRMQFDKSGKLKEYIVGGVGQTSTTEFFQGPKAWSKNKYVTDKVVTKTKAGIQTNTITNSIEYLPQSGIGFPSKITVNNISEAIIPAYGEQKEQHLKNETGSVIHFTNFEVNTGKANRYITSGIKR